MKIDYRDDFKLFASKDKFQWFVMIAVMIILLRAFNLLPETDFVMLLKYSIISVFGAEGLDQLTNFRKE